jgi:transposase
MSTEEPCPCPSVPEEFRRKVLDLVAAGRPVAQIAADLEISDQTIYDWRRQELIDTGQLPGLNRAELSELSVANKRIRELETEVAILKGPVMSFVKYLGPRCCGT